MNILHRKMGQNTLNMGRKWVKMGKMFKKMKENLDFSVCMYNTQNVAQSQLNVARSHDAADDKADPYLCLQLNQISVLQYFFLISRLHRPPTCA